MNLELFDGCWSRIPGRVRRVLKTFATYPNVGQNEGYSAGYLTSAWDGGDIDYDDYSYFLGALREVKSDADVRQAILNAED